MEERKMRMIAQINDTTEFKDGLLPVLNEMIDSYTARLVMDNDEQLRGKIKGFKEVIRCIINAKDQLTET